MQDRVFDDAVLLSFILFGVERELLSAWQLSKDEQETCLDKGRFRSQLCDRVSSILQNPSKSIDVANRTRCTEYVPITRIVDL